MMGRWWRRRPILFSMEGWRVWGRVWRDYVVPYRRVLWSSALLLLAAALVTAAHAALIQPMLDGVFLDQQAGWLPWLMGAILGLSLVKGVAHYAGMVGMKFLGQRIVADIQWRLYDRLLVLDLGVLRQESSGKMLSRFTHDIGLMRDMVSRLILGLVQELASLVGLVGVMAYHSPVLLCVVGLVVPWAVLPVVRLGKRMRGLARATQEQWGDYTVQLDRTLGHIRTIRACGQEEFESERARSMLDRMVSLYYQAARTESLSSPLMEALGGVAVVLVLGYGANQVLAGQTTPGHFFAFIAALMMAYKPMKSLSDMHNGLQQGVAAAMRVFEWLDSPLAEAELPGAVPLPEEGGCGDIVFEGVSFAYPGSSRRALDGCSFRVNEGEMVGMVGLSGSGKSTVANLLLRFYQPQEGRMVLRGRPMESWTVASTRRAMAWVSQEGALFDGTVAENLCYGVEGPTEESMRCAASWAEADGFIEALPDGYKTWIGEDGNRLSGGQRQRLALARALHQDRSLLILDEATSALDNLTEQSVQRAIERERRGRTTVIIAHRLSTLERVDRILVFEMGRVVEQGTHGELMALGGRYALMVERERQDDGSGEER